jgi:hypothetical protein
LNVLDMKTVGGGFSLQASSGFCGRIEGELQSEFKVSLKFLIQYSRMLTVKALPDDSSTQPQTTSSQHIKRVGDKPSGTKSSVTET